MRTFKSLNIGRALFLAGLTLWLVGCPVGGGSGAVAKECESAGEQCRLAPGQLGVCSTDLDGELFCMSQH